MSHPVKLSIITVNKNNAAGLKKTMESVITQDFDDYEYIVIDGGSGDESTAVIGEYEDELAYWVSEPDSGIFNAMNKGIGKASGEYCLFLNSGDALTENSLINVFSVDLSEDIIYMNTYLAYQNGDLIEQKYPKELTLYYFMSATIGHQSTLIKRKLFNQYGKYDENLKYHGDYDFWIKTIILGNCKVKYLDYFFSKYDMTGITSKVNDENIIEIWGIRRKYIPNRILLDYDNWRENEKDLYLILQLNKNKVLRIIVNLLYKISKKMNLF